MGSESAPPNSRQALALTLLLAVSTLHGCSQGTEADTAADTVADADTEAWDAEPSTDAETGPDCSPKRTQPTDVLDGQSGLCLETDTDTETDTEPDIDLPAAPSLTDVQTQVFAPSCTFSVCHRPPAIAGGLDLLSDPSGALISIPASGKPDAVLVVPGDAEASYLYEKVLVDPPSVGDVMPPGGAMEPERVELIRAWIEGGALP